MNSKHLRRYLRQYPFLWAIEKAWDIRHVEIKVERASVLAFRGSAKYLEDWWAYIENGNGTPALLGTFDCLGPADAAVSDLKESRYVKFLVFRKYLDDRRFGEDRHPSIITIYRPPHGKTFEEFLRELRGKDARS